VRKASQAHGETGGRGWLIHARHPDRTKNVADRPPTPTRARGLFRPFGPHQEEDPMAKCEVCGNDYHMSFQVVTAGVTHTFDSFECAIHKLAPICAHCGCKIIGHGIEANGTFYCCAHCAHAEGAKNIVDNAEHGARR
jgi:hypothetical protein